MRILLIAVPGGKPWNGATLYQEALGGSESAVAYLARSFSRKGHEVHVATHGQPGIFDGVTYVNQQDMADLIAQEWSVVISSRWPEVFTYPWQNVLKVLWVHDLPNTPSTNIQAHKVVALTKFHRDSWKLPEDACLVIGNGVDSSLFGGPELIRDENVLVWTSNPERGLPIAAKIFQEIRERWPDMELHIYGRSSVYGWGPGDAGDETPYLPRPEHMENVFLHEPLNKVGLAKVLREAWAWYYPAWWAETYGIAALEAQAAGTPVISVPLAGLNETVKGGILQYDFLNAISQLRNKSKWEKVSKAGKEFAFAQDWDNIADSWLEMINGALPKPVLGEDGVSVEVPQPS